MITSAAAANLIRVARSVGLCCGAMAAFLRHRGLDLPVPLWQMDYNQYRAALAFLREREMDDV